RKPCATGFIRGNSHTVAFSSTLYCRPIHEFQRHRIQGCIYFSSSASFVERSFMESFFLRRSTLNYIGLAILLVGLGAAEFIYWQGLHGDRTNDEDILL